MIPYEFVSKIVDKCLNIAHVYHVCILMMMALRSLLRDKTIVSDCFRTSIHFVLFNGIVL